MRRTPISIAAGFSIALGLSFACGLALVAFEGAAARAGELRTFEIDPARSTLEIDVSKAGLFKAFGHDHVILAKEVSGRVLLDPEKLESSSVTLRVAAPSLTVADSDVSDADRAQIQSTMLGEKALDAARFPEILFASTHVTQARKTGAGWSLTLAGNLRLHGAEKEVILPVTLKIAGEELEAQGEASILQTDYGITPVKAAGGTVKVQDSLRIHFVIHARGTSS